MAENELDLDDLKDISGGIEIERIPGLTGMIPACPGCGTEVAADMLFAAFRNAASSVKCRKCGGSIRLANNIVLGADKGGAAGSVDIREI